MKIDLEERLHKVAEEQDHDELHASELLELTIVTIEAVKAHKIQSGFHANADVQAMDQVSGILRMCR